MPNEAQTRVMLPGKHGRPASLPGGWQAAVIAAISALVVGYWARPDSGASRQGDQGPEDRNGVSRVAEVSPQDVPAALATVSGTPLELTRFREQAECGRRLAWVTLVRTPGQAPGRIRLQSGSYISPVFDLGETPVRVGLPYPAPYATGRGVISVVGVTTGAVVALNPPWPVQAHAGVQAREVSWTPTGACPGAGK